MNYMMSFKKNSYSLIFLLIVFFTTDLLAEFSYVKLHEKYLALRNSDIEVSEPADWKRLAEQLTNFREQNQTHRRAPNALFEAASLYRVLYSVSNNNEDLQRAIILYEKLAAKYVGNSLADNALVHKGDLIYFHLKDKASARRDYLEVVEGYPNSDMRALAENRLFDLQTGSINVKRSKTSTNKTVIVIDPGHGGEDFGAEGSDGLTEKEIVLEIANYLKSIVEKDLDVVVRLTREHDEFIPLAERTRFANDFEADLFISLHVNASPSGKLSGFETYYLDNTDDRASHKLAERENGPGMDLYQNGDLHFMLSDLIQSAKMEDSIQLAHEIQGQTMSHLKKNWEVSKNIGVKRAPFYVLVGAHMPCVLVEMFFINNLNDAKNLSNKAFRKDIAHGILSGIKRFLNT